MNAHRILMMLAIIALTMGLALSAPGCSADDDDDDDDDSGDDDGGDDDGDDDGDDIEDVPDDVNDFLDQDDLDKLEDAGMTIYTGDNPPNIEGTYLADTLVVTYDEVGLEGMTVVPYTMEYYDQTSDGEIKNDYAAPDAGDYGNGIGGFIAGDNGCFTAFFDFTGSITGCDYALPSIHSGCLGDDGIEDFEWGLIMKEKDGTGCDALIPEGAARVVTESDGLAAEQ